jgi:hypothetical protein
VESCEAVAPARCWFVSPEGSADNDGTFASPFGTPQAAVRQAGPGDVIYLRGGVYDDANAHDSAAVSWGDESKGTIRSFISIARVSLPTWAGGESYDVAAGTEAAPITIRSFPGERACGSGAGSIRVGSLTHETAYWHIENITMHQAPINVSGGTGNASNPQNQTHDILIKGNEVYEYAVTGGGNPGLVRVNRGDGGGPYAITVDSNILHDIIPIDGGITHQWDTTTDAQHFGGVTTLSCETYIANCGGNGELTIRNNLIYHVPQAFFFKNPALGPFHVSGNVIHDVGSLGQWSPSNITFEDNLVFAAHGGAARVGGTGGSIAEDIFERIGHHLVMQNNTFIGFNTLVFFRTYASGHTIRGNVIEGLGLSMADASWDNMGYVVQDKSWVFPDTTADITASQLATNNDFDDNCFVTGESDFLAYGRRYDSNGNIALQHLSLANARSTLGYELASDVVSSPTGAFVDFDGGDYAIVGTGPCAGRGAKVPSWWSAR